MNRTRILWLVIILLAVLNVTTIATIFIHNLNERKVEQHVVFEPGSNPLNGKCFRDELKFDNVQMERFRTSNRAFRQQANSIISSINDQKEAMFAELQNSEPDVIKLKLYSDNIGFLHAELKNETVKFYLSLKEVCTPKQNEKLQSIFKPLFDETPLPGGRGRGQGNGRGCKQ